MDYSDCLGVWPATERVDESCADENRSEEGSASRLFCSNFPEWYLEEPVMPLDRPVKQHIFDSCAGADVVNDQVAIRRV